MRQKKQIIKSGDVVMLELPGNKYMYGRQNKVTMGFYNYITDIPIKDIELLREKKYLFDVTVYKNVLSSGVWPKIGKISCDEECTCDQSLKFMGNPILGGLKYVIGGQPYGDATYQDCYALETASVWNKESVELRLFHYVKYGNDHPRMWDKWFISGHDFKAAWKELYDPEIVVDIKTLKVEFNKD